MNLRRSRPGTLLCTGGPLVVLLALASTAGAQSWPTSDPAYNPPGTGPGFVSEFGAAGQLAISTDFHLDFNYLSQSLHDQSASGSEVTVAPNLLVFVIKNLAVGGGFRFDYNSTSIDSSPLDNSGSTTELAVGPQVAYNLPVGPRVSLLPQLGLEYDYIKQSSEVAGGRSSASGHRVILLAKVPVLFHPFRHVFVGFGPTLLRDLSARFRDTDIAKRTQIGLNLEFGLWL